MKLLIMRHGSAEAFIAKDEERQLTEDGCEEVKVMAQWLKGHHPKIDLLLVSPYVRAQQTAEILTMNGVAAERTETSNDITPSGDAGSVWEYIQAVASHERLETIMLVTHMPFVSYMVEEVTHGQDAPIFATAAIAEIECNSEFSKLLSLIGPQQV